MIIDTHVHIFTEKIVTNAGNELDLEQFKNSRAEYKDARFILEGGKYYVGREVEKMSKSKYNVVSPDDICDTYGADTLRLYEMFLGPLEQAKPWNTAGITGVSSFIKKLWRLYFNEQHEFFVSDEAPGKDELKTLHKTIKKVDEDIANFYKLKTENLSSFKRILSYLATTPPGELNKNSIAKHIGLDSKTIHNYLEMSRHCFGR